MIKTYKEFRTLSIDEFEEISNQSDCIVIGGKKFHLYMESDYESGESIFVLEDEYGYAIILGSSDITYYSLRKYLDKYPSIERRLIRSFDENKTYKSNDDLFTFPI